MRPRAGRLGGRAFAKWAVVDVIYPYLANDCNTFSHDMSPLIQSATLPVGKYTGVGLDAQLRLMLNGAKPWQVGIISIRLMFTCGGSVATQ